MPTKDQVLQLLKETDAELSGERMSETLGVTRAAVNLAVQQLRAEGYIIASATRRGYRLQRSPDVVSPGELSTYLSEERLKTVQVFASCDSTNNVLRKLSFDGAPAGTVVLADAQTAGRGRSGRSFSSPAGKGIYLSYLLRPGQMDADVSTLTARTAVAMRRAIASVCKVQPDIKWVNDLLLNGKKIAGILTEMAMEGESASIDYIIVGIGINVHEKKNDFPKELREIATSLAAETGQNIRRAHLAAAMMTELDQLAAKLHDPDNSYYKEYKDACITCGKEVSLLFADQKEQAGTALSVNPDYSLTVRFPDGHKERITNGEVRVRNV